MKQPKTSLMWYHQRRWAAAIIVVALLAAYGMASLAIDSGSLLQYGIAIGLIVLSINRMAHIIILTYQKARLQHG